MPLPINLRHLEAHNVRLEGELPAEELDIDPHDDVIRVASPLRYAIEVQKLDDSLLLQGRLGLALACQCVRCLKRFEKALALDGWTLHLPLRGEEAVTVTNDCVDLTPYIREDILLEFPQHPLCDPDCRGLPNNPKGKARTGSSGRSPAGSPAWDELNKLKF
jgi:uncharacterized protein